MRVIIIHNEGKCNAFIGRKRERKVVKKGKKQKNKKSLKKVLTKGKRCDIISKLSDDRGLKESGVRG